MTAARSRLAVPIAVDVPLRAAGLVAAFTAADVVAVCLTPVAFDAVGRVVVIAVLTAQAVALLRSRTRPEPSAAVVIALGVVVAALSTSIGPGLAPAAVFALAYGTPTAVSRRGLVAVIVTSPVVLLHSPWAAVPITIATAVAVWALGGLLRAQAEQQAQAARAAAAQERAALAREVHDVVGHSLASIIVQAGAAADAFARDPELARRAVHAIDDNARSALGEVRRVISGAGERHGLVDLPDLTAGVRSGGVAASVRVEGDVSTVPEAVGSSVYRIVQESLTNAMRHGAARTVHVVVRCAAERVTVQVTDDGGRGPTERVDVSTSGSGIAGMRARAELHGGSLSAGPGPDGGFRVDASLPVVTT